MAVDTDKYGSSSKFCCGYEKLEDGKFQCSTFESSTVIIDEFSGESRKCFTFDKAPSGENSYLNYMNKAEDRGDDLSEIEK